MKLKNNMGLKEEAEAAVEQRRQERIKLQNDRFKATLKKALNRNPSDIVRKEEDYFGFDFDLDGLEFLYNKHEDMLFLKYYNDESDRQEGRPYLYSVISTLDLGLALKKIEQRKIRGAERAEREACEATQSKPSFWHKIKEFFSGRTIHTDPR